MRVTYHVLYVPEKPEEGEDELTAVYQIYYFLKLKA